MVDSVDLRRLEDKVDKITDALNKLVLVEERQTNQGVRIGELEREVVALRTSGSSTDKELARWVNRGIGVWVAVGILFAAFTTYIEVIKK